MYISHKRSITSDKAKEDSDLKMLFFSSLSTAPMIFQDLTELITNLKSNSFYSSTTQSTHK